MTVVKTREGTDISVLFVILSRSIALTVSILLCIEECLLAPSIFLSHKKLWNWHFTLNVLKQLDSILVVQYPLRRARNFYNVSRKGITLTVFVSALTSVRRFQCVGLIRAPGSFIKQVQVSR